MEYSRELLYKLHEKRRHLRIVFFACLFFLSTSIFFLYYYNEEVSQQILIQQMQERQIVIARAGGLFIGEFFTTIKNQLLALAAAPSIQEQVSGRSQKLISSVFATHQEDDHALFAIGFLDSSGTVTAISDQDGKIATIGKNYAYRNYFTWTKDKAHKRQVYLSDPFIASGPLAKGKMIMMMTTPVYSSAGHYQGAIFALIRLDEFTKTYITPLSATDSEVWLINSKGTLLAGGDSGEKVGMNFVSYASLHIWPQRDEFLYSLHRLLGKDAESFHWFYRMQSGGVEEVYGISNQINIFGQKNWLLIAMPKQEILSSVSTPLALVAIPVFAIIATLTLGFLFVFVVRFAQKEIYTEGFLAGKEAREKEKSK